MVLKPLTFQDQLVKVLKIKVCAQQRFAKIKGDKTKRILSDDVRSHNKIRRDR